MDNAQLNTYNMMEDQVDVAAKKRLESFQFRPMSNPGISQSKASKTNHARSRSKTNSISSLSQLNFANSFVSSQSATEMTSSASMNSRPSSLVGTRSRPASHHRRLSSVSTRVESAEVMGITLPDIPQSSSDDNINFGDKDSIRRRALLALEGRTEFGSDNAVVEIPQLDNVLKASSPKSMDFPVKPSPLIGSSFGLGNGLSKRDSFGKLLNSSSMKDQLHTLMEEEEEDDEVTGQERLPITPARSDSYLSSKAAFSDIDREPLTSFDANISESSDTAATPEVSITTPSPQIQRHRPKSLVLRPLSLNPATTVTAGLPTPTATPSPRGMRLKSLTLSPLANDGSSPVPSPHSARRQSSLGFSSSPLPSHTVTSRRQSSSESSPSPSSSVNSKRQSSISYFRSGASPTPSLSLPTPGATPTSEKRQSFPTSISDSESISSFERPHSAAESEQAFLTQSHAALIARIAELERALQARPHSRSASALSDYSFVQSELATDDMFQLVTDLKAERDELTRDIDGWRQRVKDLEHSKTVLERRIEAERREGWLKGEQLCLLEVEKAGLSRQLKAKEAEVEGLAKDMESARLSLRRATDERETLAKSLEETKRQLRSAQNALARKSDLEVELEAVKNDLLAEKQRRTEIEFMLENSGVMDTPKPAFKIPTLLSKLNRSSVTQMHGNANSFTSIDSEATDVDTLDDRRVRLPLTLKAVEEEPESHCFNDSEGDDELAHYEEENESDMSFMSSVRSSSTSSLFDVDDQPRSTSHLHTDVHYKSELPSRSISTLPIALPNPWDTPSTPVLRDRSDVQHAKRASLSRTWTFPKDGLTNLQSRQDDEVDRFFGCLDDIEGSPTLNTLGDKSLFSKSLQHDDDEEDMTLPPFVLPTNTSGFPMLLDVVIEEDDEEIFQGEKVDGGVKFSFPLISKPVPAKEENGSSTNKSMQAVSQYMFPSISSVFSVPNAPFLAPSGQRSAPSTPRAVSGTRIPPPSPPRSSKQQMPKAVDPEPTTKYAKSASIPATKFTPAPRLPSKQNNEAAKKIEKPVVATPVSKTNSQRVAMPLTPSKTQQQRNGGSKFGFGGRTNDDPNFVNNSSSSTISDRFTASSSSTQVNDSLPVPLPYDMDGGAPDERCKTPTPSSPFDVFRSTPISSRFTLQTFTNLIPSLPSLSWTSPSSSSSTNSPTLPAQQYSSIPSNKHYDPPSHLSSDGVDDLQKKTKKTDKKQPFGYVPKEKQILKLRERMILERRETMRRMLSGGEADVEYNYSHAEDDVFREGGVPKMIRRTDSMRRTGIGFERCGKCSGDLISL